MKRKRRYYRRGKFIPILPSLITTFGLILGLASMMTSISIVNYSASGESSAQWLHERFWWAAGFIGIAVVVDMFDGKIARALNSESRFGAAYDSLCDLVSFGVAPVFLLYVCGLSDYGKPGLMAMLFYVICVALRLARFNIQSTGREKRMFTGLPSPMGAALIFSPILLFSGFGVESPQVMKTGYLFFIPFVGIIMVSEIPFRKFPRFEGSGPFGTLVAGAVLITALVTNPGIFAAAVAYGYFLFHIGRFVWKLGDKAALSKKKQQDIAERTS